MTGLQWAVLTAYARVLPVGSEGRAMIEEATQKEAPTVQGQRIALKVAKQSGMLSKDGRITEFGRTAAKRFMPLLALKIRRQV